MRLDFIVDMAEKEGLKPMSEDEANLLIESDPNYAPWDHYDDFAP